MELRKINLKDAVDQWEYTSALPEDENGLTIQLAKDIVPEEEIYLRVNKDNLASQKCMLANGAYKAGEDEEHYFMRIPEL